MSFSFKIHDQWQIIQISEIKIAKNMFDGISYFFIFGQIEHLFENRYYFLFIVLANKCYWGDKILFSFILSFL